MLALALTAHVAQADPVGMSQGWSGQLTGFTGVEQWSGAGSMVGGLQGSMGLQHRRRADWQAAASGEVMWWQETPYDLLIAEAQVTTQDAVAPGIALSSMGSRTSGWSDHTAAVVGSLKFDEHRLQLRLGPSIRTDGTAVTGGSATALWTADLSRQVSTWARLDTDRWSGDAWNLGTDLGAMWSPRPDVLLLAGMGLSVTGGEHTDWWAGLPPSGSRILRGHLIADRRLTPHLALRVKLSGDQGFGSLDYGHARVTVGLSARTGRTRIQALPPPPVMFSISAPEAATVSVVGSFNEWLPDAMVRNVDGTWHLSLPLKRGLYEYVYLIDGQPQTPPEAERHNSDGFGGENGVLVVGG